MQRLLGILDARGIPYGTLSRPQFRDMMNKLTGAQVYASERIEEGAEIWLQALEATPTGDAQ